MDLEDTEATELRSEGLAFSQYLSHLSASPNCADPDHPGCARCADHNDEHDAGAMRVLLGAPL